MSAFFDELRRRYSDHAAFVAALRARMAAHGITQSALAARAGFQPTHVSKWLRRERAVRPAMETMVILDEALDRLIKGD